MSHSTIKEKNETAEVPKIALVELTNACNHACVFCFNPEMKRKISCLDMPTYENFIKKSVNEGLEEVGLYSTGEPFMTKNLDEYILLAKKLGIKDLNKKYNISDMIKGDVIFCATGVTDGDFVKGIIDAGDSFISETLVLHQSSKTNKIIKNQIKKWVPLL